MNMSMEQTQQPAQTPSRPKIQLSESAPLHPQYQDQGQDQDLKHDSLSPSQQHPLHRQPQVTEPEVAAEPANDSYSQSNGQFFIMHPLSSLLPRLLTLPHPLVLFHYHQTETPHPRAQHSKPGTQLHPNPNHHPTKQRKSPTNPTSSP